MFLAILLALHVPFGHGCAIYRYIDDQHRNTNMNDKDHLVGQLTNSQDATAEEFGLGGSVCSFNLIQNTLDCVPLI